MITIDIAQRAASRTVVRPNDGPGDWSARRALARKMRDLASRKAVKIDRPKSHAELRLEAIERAKVAVLKILAASSFGVNQQHCVEVMGLGRTRSEASLKEMEIAGLIDRISDVRIGGGKSITIQITEDGLVSLDDGGGDDQC